MPSRVRHETGRSPRWRAWRRRRWNEAASMNRSSSPNSSVPSLRAWGVEATTQQQRTGAREAMLRMATRRRVVIPFAIARPSREQRATLHLASSAHQPPRQCLLRLCLPTTPSARTRAECHAPSASCGRRRVSSVHSPPSRLASSCRSTNRRRVSSGISSRRASSRPHHEPTGRNSSRVRRPCHCRVHQARQRRRAPSRRAPSRPAGKSMAS